MKIFKINGLNPAIILRILSYPGNEKASPSQNLIQPKGLFTARIVVIHAANHNYCQGRSYTVLTNLN